MFENKNGKTSNVFLYIALKEKRCSVSRFALASCLFSRQVRIQTMMPITIRAPTTAKVIHTRAPPGLTYNSADHLKKKFVKSIRKILKLFEKNLISV
jgi:hypothetical protein